MPEDYIMMPSETLQFDKPEAALELEVDKVEAQGKGWMIALVSKKVYPLWYYNFRICPTLMNICTGL